jgi:hypothetical protein
MSSCVRYNGSTGFGRYMYSPLVGKGETIHEMHLTWLPTRVVPRAAHSIGGLVEGIPNLISELNGVEYLIQQASTDTLLQYTAVTTTKPALGHWLPPGCC